MWLTLTWRLVQEKTHQRTKKGRPKGNTSGGIGGIIDERSSSNISLTRKPSRQSSDPYGFKYYTMPITVEDRYVLAWHSRSSPHPELKRLAHRSSGSGLPSRG